MITTDFFWTDSRQAQERLLNSVVLYDGEPVYVVDIEDHRDGVPRGIIVPVHTIGTDDYKPQRKMLNNPKFERFRVFPKLGWFNARNQKLGPFFIERKPTVGQRHGIAQGNSVVYSFEFAKGVDSACTLYKKDYQLFRTGSPLLDEGWLDGHHGKYPSLRATLLNIAPNTAIAISNKYCVVRDGTGLRWLFRNKERIGIFANSDTISLLNNGACYREELMESPIIDVNTIQEF